MDTRIINGFSNYTINKNGNVTNRSRNKPVKSRIGRGGYIYLSIMGDNGVRKQWLVHRLLAMTYIPNPLNKPQVNHIDGNKLNNSLDNLEWVTVSENIQHAYDTGLHIKASSVNSPNTKLTKGDVLLICSMIKAGLSNKEISTSLRISEYPVKSIRYKATFKDIVLPFFDSK